MLQFKSVESSFLYKLIYSMLWNFDFFERIIGLNLENNRKLFRRCGIEYFEHNCLEPKQQQQKPH